MRKLVAVTTTAAALAGGALTTAAPAGASATRSFEGRVVSVDRSARAFRLSDAEAGTKRIRIVRSTAFERVSFASLRPGQTGIEVVARRSGGRWIAVSVERSDGGGSHGGHGGQGGHGGGVD